MPVYQTTRRLRTPGLATLRFVCYIRVYHQEVKACKPITMDNDVTCHWCRNKNVHISKHNGCDSAQLLVLAVSISFVVYCTISNRKLTFRLVSRSSTKCPRQRVLHGASLLRHILMDLIVCCLSELDAIRHAKRKAVYHIQKESTFGVNRSTKLLCLLTDNQLSKEDII